MRIVTIGTDTETVDALREAGHGVTTTDSFGTDALREAGVAEADAVVVGDGFPTQVVVAKEVNPEARLVFVADNAPEFVSGNADLILSSELAERLPDALGEEEEEEE